MSAIAWFDERGKNELQELDLEFAANFSAHTGLGFKAESSFSKLLWRKRLGADIPVGSRWLNALEYIAYRLTGTSITEPSLASRTGLFDQQTSNPWIPALEQIGADTTLIPELHAGRDFNRPGGGVCSRGTPRSRGHRCRPRPSGRSRWRGREQVRMICTIHAGLPMLCCAQLSGFSQMTSAPR